MKVCFISPGATSLFYPERPPTHGGAEAQLYLFAGELAQHHNIEIHFIFNDERKTQLLQNNIHGHSIPIGPGLRPKLAMQNLLCKINADIYLQMAVGSVTRDVACFCKWRRKKFVYWIASDLDVNPDMKMEVVRTKGFEWGMLSAQQIIAQTETQATLLKLNFGRQSIKIMNAFPRREIPQKERDGILWVGRFVPVKRPELLIQLARCLPHRHFTMIAPVTKREYQEVHQNYMPAIEELPNLEYIDGVPLNEIGSWFDRTKLLLNTSVIEGYPNTFVQAMWSAAPLASLSFDPDEMIAKQELGIPPRDNVEEFAKKN